MEIFILVAEILIAIVLLALICVFAKRGNVLAVIILVFLLLLDAFIMTDIMPQLFR